MEHCPHCNQPVTLKSNSTQMLKCGHCKKTLAVSALGSLCVTADLTGEPPQTGFLRMGATGKYEKKIFTITGRIFVQNDDGVYNYWQITFDSGESDLLSEGYGHYAILTKTGTDINTEELRKMTTGLKTISCNGKKYRLVRKKKFDEILLEGEASWPPADKGIESFELFNETGSSIEVIDFGKAGCIAYNCEFYLPQQLELSTSAVEKKDLNTRCEKCNTAHTIAALPYTLLFNCLQCGTTHIYNRTSKRFEKYGPGKRIPESYLQIGSIGKLDGIEFKVIGMASKQERTVDAAVWHEYTLYNPVQGFAYLSEFQGNWVYVKEWPKPPLITEKGTDYFVENENEFELFNDYSYKVLAAAGEHIYDLEKTSNIKVTEFICPPQTLIQEMNSTEEVWFFGEHLEVNVLERNFVMPRGKPEKYGIGSIEPAGMINKSDFIRTLLAGIGLLALLHFAFISQRQEKILFSEQVSFPQGQFTVSGVTPRFQLTKDESNLQLIINSSLNNSWLEAEGSFVNTKTGKEYPFNKVVEFYQGYEDGERWTEGNKLEEKVVTGIPGGTYYMEYKVVQDSSVQLTQPSYFSGITDNSPKAEATPFFLEIKYDVPLHSNLLFSAGLVLLAGVIIYGRFYYIDKKRWYNSKYSKYSVDE